MGSARFDAAVAELLREQRGVVARRQLVGVGVTDPTLRRWLRGRHLVPVVRGVYVAHTGRLTGWQRAWVGVLMAWPAVLAGRTAIQAGLRREPTGVIELAVEPGRKVVAPAGFSVVRRTGLGRRASWNLSPPRLRIEDAALDVAAALGESYVAVETLAEVCRERATTPDRLLDALQARGKIAHRRFLRDALYDVRDGATSVLERGYLELERAHALPGASRQKRERLDGVLTICDADYAAYGVVIELDDSVTLRLGWRQVIDDGCTTAAHVARLLAARGWQGAPKPCSPTCTLTRAA